MNRFLKLALVASPMLVFSGCLITVSPDPTPTPATATLQATFTQVTGVTATEILGAGSYSFTGGSGANPGSSSGGSSSGLISNGITLPEPTLGSEITVNFGPGVDASDCLATAQQAQSSGVGLLISGAGSAVSPVSTSCPTGETCEEPAITTTPIITFTQLTGCTLGTTGGTSSSGSSSGGGAVNFTTHFTAVTSASAGYTCPTGTQCAIPDICREGEPNCGFSLDSTIVGPATTTYDDGGTTTTSQLSQGPVITTLSFLPADDSTGCVAVATKAKADGRGLTVTGIATTLTPLPYPVANCPVETGSNLTCDPTPVTSSTVNASKILTCVEDGDETAEPGNS